MGFQVQLSYTSKIAVILNKKAKVRSELLNFILIFYLEFEANLDCVGKVVENHLLIIVRINASNMYNNLSI